MNQKERRQRIPEHRQGEGGVLERGEGEDTPQSVARKGWGGIVCRRRGRGRLVRGEARVGHDLESFRDVTKSTVGIFSNSATFSTSHCPPAATHVRFFFAPTDHLSFLQVQRTPLSLANREGGCPFFFFTTPRPFRS
jgi:hypothetical protein